MAVALQDRWTKTSRFWQIGTRQYQGAVTVGAQNYQDELGTYRACDPDAWVPYGPDGYDVINRSMPYAVAVRSTDGKRRIFPYRTDLTKWVEISPPVGVTGLAKGPGMTWGKSGVTFRLVLKPNICQMEAWLGDAALSEVAWDFAVNGLTRKDATFLLGGKPSVWLGTPHLREKLPTKLSADYVTKAVAPAVSFSKSRVMVGVPLSGFKFPAVMHDADGFATVDVAADSDDYYYNASYGEASHEGGSLYIGQISSNAVYTGFRFLNVSIPATVAAASGGSVDTMTLSATTSGWDGSALTTTVSLEDSDGSPVTFAAASDPHDRTLTTANGTMAISDAPDTLNTSASLAAAGQEIVDSYGAITHIVAIAVNATTAAYKVVYANEHASGAPGQLTYTYTEGGAPAARRRIFVVS